jgi:hypothetical protein
VQPPAGTFYLLWVYVEGRDAGYAEPIEKYLGTDAPAAATFQYMLPSQPVTGQIAEPLSLAAVLVGGTHRVVHGQALHRVEFHRTPLVAVNR